MSTFLQAADLPQSLRSQYLASLCEPQEWFLEELVRSGEVWVCADAGYGVFHKDTLVEFFANRPDIAPGLLSDLLLQRPCKKALCKSYDVAFLDAAKRLGCTLTETGYLFRKRLPVSLNKSTGFQIVRARSTDLAEVWQSGQDFYDSADEVEALFRAKGLWIAFDAGQMVGSGVTISIDASGDVVDIGMVTRPGLRNKGYASLTVSELANRLEREGKRPICGCAAHNLASKSALENAGFVSEHRLVQIALSI